jgi:hypothetical protein
MSLDESSSCTLPVDAFSSKAALELPAARLSVIIPLFLESSGSLSR